MVSVNTNASLGLQIPLCVARTLDAYSLRYESWESTDKASSSHWIEPTRRGAWNALAVKKDLASWAINTGISRIYVLVRLDADTF